MTIAHRSTLVVHGRLAMREARLAAGREKRQGLQIMSFEQAAVRLAGGFVRPIDDESLRTAIQAALPATPMGELESIKDLPGMIDAAVDTLHKAWRAGIDLAMRAADHPRLAAIVRLEAAVIERLPAGMMRPVDIVATATARINHATAVLGPMEIAGLTELSPCWRPLLQALTAYIPVRWAAGPRSVPAWLDGTGVAIVRTTKRLERAKHRIAMLTAEIEDYYGHFRVSTDLIELRNLLQCAQLIVRSALERKESRGLHYTLDYPALLPQAKDTVLVP